MTAICWKIIKLTLKNKMMYNSNRIENIFKVRTLIVIMMCLVLNNIYAHIVFTNFVNLLENQDVYDWIAISNSPRISCGI